MRGKVKRTTISDPRIPKPLDLVDRNFAPLAPDRLWVADFTYVSTWSGWCYTAFVIDAYARRILGWAPQVGAQEGLERTIAWFRSHGQTPALSPEATEEILYGAEQPPAHAPEQPRAAS